MNVIILAAGKGRRLKGYNHKPKCLIKIGKESLIFRLIRLLRKKNLNNIIIVIGYKGHLIKRHLAGVLNIIFVKNRRFQKGSIISLFLAKEYLNNDALIMDADVYCQEEVLDRLIYSRHKNCFLIDTTSNSVGEEMMLGAERGSVKKIARNLGKSFEVKGEGVGFIKLSKDNALLLCEIITQLIKEGYFDFEYEQALQILLNKRRISFEKIDKLLWTEIDFPEDIEKAKNINSKLAEESKVGYDTRN